MSDVQFDEDNSSWNLRAGQQVQPLFVRLLLKTGVVKDATQANYVLLGIAVCALLLTAWIIKSTFFSTPSAGRMAVPNGAFPQAFPAGQGASQIKP